jgi:hypothetical protein
LAFWLFGFLAFWLFGFLAFWLFGFLAFWPFWLFGFLAFWLFGFLAWQLFGNCFGYFFKKKYFGHSAHKTSGLEEKAQEHKTHLPIPRKDKLRETFFFKVPPRPVQQNLFMP